MVAEIPLAPEFDDGVMRCPSLDGFEDSACIRELGLSVQNHRPASKWTYWSHWRVSYRIYDVMRVTCDLALAKSRDGFEIKPTGAVAEIVLRAMLMHPGHRSQPSN